MSRVSTIKRSMLAALIVSLVIPITAAPGWSWGGNNGWHHGLIGNTLHNGFVNLNGFHNGFVNTGFHNGFVNNGCNGQFVGNGFVGNGGFGSYYCGNSCH